MVLGSFPVRTAVFWLIDLDVDNSGKSNIIKSSSSATKNVFSFNRKVLIFDKRIVKLFLF